MAQENDSRHMTHSHIISSECDAKSCGCDIFHLCICVICHCVSTALAYTSGGPLSLKAKRCFHISHHIGFNRSAHCALTTTTDQHRRRMHTPPRHQWRRTHLHLERPPLDKPATTATTATQSADDQPGTTVSAGSVMRPSKATGNASQGGNPPSTHL